MNEIAYLNKKLKEARRKRFFALLHFRRQVKSASKDLLNIVENVFLLGYDKGVENGK